MDQKLKIGTKIRVARITAETPLKQKELAEKLGIKAATLWKIEAGKRNPTYAQVRKISEILDVDLMPFEPGELRRAAMTYEESHGQFPPEGVGREEEPPRPAPTVGDVVTAIRSCPEIGKPEKRVLADAALLFARKWELENLDPGGEEH